VAVQDWALLLDDTPDELAPNDGFPIVTPRAVYPGQLPAVASVPLEVFEPCAVISRKCNGCVGFVGAALLDRLKLIRVEAHVRSVMFVIKNRPLKPAEYRAYP